MRFSVLAWIALVVGCAEPTAPVLVGQWGGPEVSLVLNRSGGSLGYQCGAGTVDPTWTLGQDGHFRAAGQHFFGGGPAPAQGRPPHPASYDGQLRGNSFILTVTVTDLHQLLGPYRMARNGALVSELCV